MANLLDRLYWLADRTGTVDGRQTILDARTKIKRLQGIESALRKIADMPYSCDHFGRNDCCGCIGSAITVAETALEAEAKGV